MYKGIIRYFSILTILLLMWNLVSGYFLFLVFVLFLILPLFSFALSFHGMKVMTLSLDVGRLIKERGESFQVIMKRQQSLLGCGPIYAQCALYDYQNQEIMVKTIVLHNDMYKEMLEGLHSGYYTFKIKQCYVFDYLQCFFLKKTNEMKQSFYIFPKQLHYQFQYDELMNEGQEDTMYSSMNPGDDYTEIYDLHQLRSDDSFHHIHWKASLKKNQWLVKEGSLPLSKHILLILGEYNDDNLDYFYTICCDLLQQHIVYDVLYIESKNHIQFMSISHEDHLRQCLKILLKTPFLFNENEHHLLTEAYLIKNQKIEVIHQ